MNITKDWALIKKTFHQAINSSGHYAIASIDKNGNPHITPIGSLMLGKAGTGIYFERFTRNMPKNFTHNKHICVLAVNGGKWFWLKAILLGRFSSPPAIRLSGKVGEKRPATQAELALWHKQVGSLSFSKGYKTVWADMDTVRDITFNEAKPVHIGNMTKNIIYTKA